MRSTGLRFHAPKPGEDPTAYLMTRGIRISAAGCWIWPRTNWAGYGAAITVNGRRSSAHRAVWLLLVGDVAPDLDLDHLCRVRCCVNPDHLEPVTRGENLRRSWAVGGANRNKRSCVNGHRLDSNNTYTSPGSRPECKTCREAARARHRTRKASS